MNPTPASDVVPTPLRMIWRRRIPAGSLTVIAGKPGLGKSSLATTIAAELSRKGKTAIISNLEDDPAAVIRPRLDVAGADLSRVLLVPPAEAPALPRDMDALGDLIRATKAAILFMDPIAGHFRPEGKVHDRRTLADLLALARSTGCAIVGIHHTTKSSIDGTAIGAIGGPSGGLSGSARAVYLFGHDPDDEDQRALACAKINGVDEPAGLTIAHETVEYASADGRLIEAGRLRIGRERNVRTLAVLHPGKKQRERDAECLKWLTDFLAAGDGGQQAVREIREKGLAVGFGWQTLRRASTTLEVDKVRIGWGGDGFWLWRLPEGHPSREPVA